ncbi:MAG TPA: hypothetical protein VGL77_05540, partial [Armatimonadota bacterium]
MIEHPIAVYINWAAYDELSDNVELTEALAMRQLDEMLRLRDLGVRLDYYMMDAFWYASDGAYRTWRTPHWPDGPERWLKRCLDNGVKPGLWVMANTLVKLDPAPAWQDSLDEEQRALCCFYGGYLPDFMQALHEWYQRGVRLFKFDFANFHAAPVHLQETMLPSEIRSANVAAFQGALKSFRREHPEVVFIAYNGYEERQIMARTDIPIRKAVDQRWVETFDSIYCGDPVPADVPCMNFWRAKDIYSDHQTRAFLLNGIPVTRIDNAGFMVGTTGTCYFRRTAAWQGMLILSLARGGWVNTYYGNLDLIDAEKAAWFAKAQSIFLPLQDRTRAEVFGGLPGKAEPYGFALCAGDDGLLTVVNPSQTIATLALPAQGAMRLLFRDAGFLPVLADGQITLGPEQMALIGVGSYADPDYDLGVQDDVLIPSEIARLDVPFSADGEKAITATLTAPADGVLRVILRQHESPTRVKRTSGGSPPDGISLGKIFTITATQGNREIPVTINYDKAMWSGLSWAVGELSLAGLQADMPLTVRCATTEPAAVTLY